MRRYEELGNEAGQASVGLSIGQVYSVQGRHQEAIGYVEQALAGFEAAGHPAYAIALNSLSWCQTQLGDYAAALATGERALAVHREAGNRDGEAHVFDTLGYAYHHLGRYAEAV